MPEGTRRPVSLIARVEDEDPETGEAVYGTAVEASRRARAVDQTAKLQHLSARPREPGPASDSGYSSLVNSSLANEELAMAEPANNRSGAPPVQRPSGGNPSRSSSKPVLHSAESTVATVDEGSHDSERRFTLPDRERRSSSARPSHSAQSQYPAPPYHASQPQQPFPQLHQQPLPQQQQARPQYPPQYPSYQAQPYSQPYPIPNAGQMPPPPVPLSAGPRPRRLSSNTSRPMSMHIYGSSYDGSIRGPPPSNSAYMAGPQYSPVVSSQPSGEYFGAAQPHRVPVNVPPYTPTSPTSPTQPSIYSARYGKTQTSFGGVLDPPRVASVPPIPIGRTPSFSARRGSITAPVPRTTRQITDRDSSSSSEDSYSDGDNHYPKNSAMLHPSRRPQYETHTSAQSIPRGIMRQYDSRRMSRSDTGVEYQETDSDRAARAMLQGSQPSSSHGPRRPSISTANSGSRRQQVVGPNGQDYRALQSRGEDRVSRREDWTQTEIDAYRHERGLGHLEEEFGRMRVVDRLEAKERNAQRYQTTNGTASSDLTAEMLAQMKQQADQGQQQHSQQQLNRRSGSHVSGRTHHSRRSGSISQHTMSNEYVTIKDAETGLAMAHVAPGQTIEVMRTEGGGMRTVINSSSGQESGYHGSSRSSRSGGHRRSYYGSSDYSASRRPTQEEIDYDSSGYERAI